MSTALYISLDPQVPGLDPNAKDKSFLADLVADADAMGKLAKSLGVRSLSDFQSYSADDFSDFLDDGGDEGLKEVLSSQKAEWFDPSEALPAVRALASHYATERYIRRRARRVAGKWEDADRTDDLLKELNHTEQVLVAAAQHGARFRFNIGF